MSYESPIAIFEETVSSQYNKALEEAVWKEVIRIGVTVDKDELIRALQYDRDQYDRGYNDGLNANRLISTKDKFPDFNEYVLVSSDAFESGFFVLCRSEYGGWHDEECDNWIADCEVKAWQPLPEPYKED